MQVSLRYFTTNKLLDDCLGKVGVENFKLGGVPPLGCLETVAPRPQLGEVRREQPRDADAGHESHELS